MTHAQLAAAIERLERRKARRRAGIPDDEDGVFE
jgi:hypothetical protein